MLASKVSNVKQAELQGRKGSIKGLPSCKFTAVPETYLLTRLIGGDKSIAACKWYSADNSGGWRRSPCRSEYHAMSIDPWFTFSFKSSPAARDEAGVWQMSGKGPQ